MKNTPVLFVLAAVVCLAGVFMGECDGAKTGKAEKPDLETRVPLGATAPVIDGKFDEKEWEKAACVSGFITDGKDWAPEQSSAYLAICDGILYVAMRCLKAPPFELKAQKRQADSMEIFGDESVEIFIMPDPGKDVYYHFAINALGSVYTAQCGGGGEKREESWNPKMEAVCEAFAGGWVLEAKIDLSSMGVGARLGDKWKINFGRNSALSQGSFSSSWTGQGDFNAPALFGSCVVSKSGGLGYSLEKINMSAADLVVRNADCEPRECELAVQSALSGVDRKKLIIPPFSATPVRLSTPGEAPGDLEISIGFGDSRSLNVKTAFMSYECGGMFSVTPSLYYCRPGETISSKVDSRLENVDSIKVAVIGPGQINSLREITLKAGEKSFSFDTKDMKPGRHLIFSVATDAKGKVLGSDEKVFIVVKEGEAAPLPEKKKFGLDGRLIKMNGELFFPFMSCHPPEGNSSPLADDSFNVNLGNIGIRKNAASFGTCGYSSTLSRVGSTHFEAPEKEKVFARMKTVIEKGGNTNIICRRLQYEAAIPLFRKTEGLPALEPVPVKEEYTDCYKLLKRTFPDMLVSIQNDQAASLPEFVGCADIIEVAPPSSYAKKLLRKFESDLAGARATVGAKPLMLWIGVSIPTPDARSAENLRAASWLAVLGGANGIVYHLGHDGVPEDRTRLWSVFKNLGREVEVLYPIVTTGEMVAAGLVSCDSSFIILSARKFQGDIYVMAVSKAAGATKARIKIKPVLADSAEVLFEGRSVKMTNGEFEDSFTSFEPHLYRMKARD